MLKLFNRARKQALSKLKKDQNVLSDRISDLEHKSLLLTENIDLDFRDDIIKKFTYFTHNLHENGIMFLDHSRSNTLVKKHNDDYRFYLIDLNRMKFKSLSVDERFKNFRRLKLNDEILEKVSGFYSEIVNIEKQIIFDKIKKYSDDFENGRKCRKRLKKFFRL